LITDDPGTPGNHHWEINMGWIAYLGIQFLVGPREPANNPGAPTPR
jgi:hypothetical protein